ncbi:MAG: diguanylate cyclase, partial [Burkholderiaceae bacterium]
MPVAHVSSLSPPVARPTGSRDWAWRTSLLLVACFVTGSIGLSMPQVGDHATLFWPPMGIALAAMLRFGPNLWPGAFIGAMLVGLTHGLSPWLSLAVAMGSTFAPVLGVWALTREGLHVELDRRRDLWLYGVIGVGLTSLVSASNGIFWLAASGVIGWPAAPIALATWWVGDAIGALVVGIPLLTLSGSSLQHAFGERRWIRTVLLTFGVFASAWLATASPEIGRTGPSPVYFLPHLLLYWLAARSGLFAASATALLLAAATVLATAHGLGPFGHSDSNLVAWMLAGHVCSLLAIPLLTTALTGEMAANERRWQLALDTSQIGVGQWDVAAQRIELSPRWLALLGHDTARFDGSLESFWALLHPDDLGAVKQALQPLGWRIAINGSTECRMRCHDGSWRRFELHVLVAERGSTGAPARVLVTARDISDLQAARERRDLSHTVFQHLHEGVLITDAQHRVQAVNPTYTTITGHSREELLGSVAPLLRPGPPNSELALKQAAIHAAIESGGSWRGELRHERSDGEPCLLQVTVTAVVDPDGSLRNLMIAVVDITDVRQKLEQLQRQAHLDELTRLPNRARLAQMLQAAMQTSRREGSLLTVCYLDLDHFKPVNDRFGHDAGDRLLHEVANRMRQSLRSWAGGDDVVARIGGDEFVLLLRTATLEESRHAVERVLNQVSQPYTLGVGAGPVMVTASIGATVFPLDGADAETLLRHADHAMYGAKQAGRNGYLFFDTEHDRRAEARFVALGRIQGALDADEFRLHFQPKVDMRNGRVLGLEALLRWNHPDQGLISPAQFLPLIENTGLSISVGNWVLQHGIEQLARWLDMGLDLTVSVNVAARHLQE